MKKKLFALAGIAALYVLFIFAFTALDNQGKVSKFFSDVGLSNGTAMASTDLKSKSNPTQSIKNPMPPPPPPPIPIGPGNGSLISQ